MDPFKNSIWQTLLQQFLKREGYTTVLELHDEYSKLELRIPNRLFLTNIVHMEGNIQYVNNIKYSFDFCTPSAAHFVLLCFR